MLTRGRTIVYADGAETWKRCECGASFPLEFNSRGQMTSRKLCDACRIEREKRTADVLPETQGVQRCVDCSALVGLDWGTVTYLDAQGRCRACAAWYRKTLTRQREERLGYRYTGGLRFDSPPPQLPPLPRQAALNWAPLAAAPPALLPEPPAPTPHIKLPPEEEARLRQVVGEQARMRNELLRRQPTIPRTILEALGQVPLPPPAPDAELPPDFLMTTDMAARRLYITKGKLRYLIAQGRIPAELHEGRLLIRAGALKRERGS